VRTTGSLVASIVLFYLGWSIAGFVLLDWVPFMSNAGFLVEVANVGVLWLVAPAFIAYTLLTSVPDILKASKPKSAAVAFTVIITMANSLMAIGVFSNPNSDAVQKVLACCMVVSTLVGAFVAWSELEDTSRHATLDESNEHALEATA